MTALMLSLVSTYGTKLLTGLLLFLLTVLPAVYFKTQAVSLEHALVTQTNEAAKWRTIATTIQAQADEQKRALEVVYAAARQRNRLLAQDLEKLRKAPPPADCKGSMDWLRAKALEMTP